MDCAVELQGMILHEECFFDMEAKGSSQMAYFVKCMGQQKHLKALS